MPIGLPNTRYSLDPLADTRTDSTPGSHWQYVTYVCFRSDVKIRETETDYKPILDTPMAMTESDVHDPIALFHAWFAEAKEKESDDPTDMADRQSRRLTSSHSSSSRTK